MKHVDRESKDWQIHGRFHVSRATGVGSSCQNALIYTRKIIWLITNFTRQNFNLAYNKPGCYEYRSCLLYSFVCRTYILPLSFDSIQAATPHPHVLPHRPTTPASSLCALLSSSKIRWVCLQSICHVFTYLEFVICIAVQIGYWKFRRSYVFETWMA